MPRSRMRWSALLFFALQPTPALVGQAGPPAAPTSRSAVSGDRALRGLDDFVARVMKEWQVPGLALGVIQDGKPVLLKGYGYRDVEKRLPETPRTLMAIGSNTKSFTVVLMGMLADSGKLEWDKPVRTYLPDFQLYDDFATREMTPRDLVTHRSGLPRHDGLWYGRSFNREELYRRLKYLEPSASFRSRWQYQNLMFLTAGYLVERRTGRSWDDLIRERVFAPLEMTRSNTSVRDLPAADDAGAGVRLARLPGGEGRRHGGDGRGGGGGGAVFHRMRPGPGAVPQHRRRSAGGVHQLGRRGDAALHPVPHRLRSLQRARDPLEGERKPHGDAANAGGRSGNLAGRVGRGHLRIGPERHQLPRAEARAARGRDRRLHLADVLATEGADRDHGGHEHVGHQSRAQHRDTERDR